MSAQEHPQPPVRDWDSAPCVVRARRLLARGRFRAALNEAWKAARTVVDADDESGYSVVRVLADEIGARATGRSQRNAAILSSYLGHCREASDAGRRQGSLLARLFGGRGAPATKVCPECAEDVKAAARVCRFCNHSFGEG